MCVYIYMYIGYFVSKTLVIQVWLKDIELSFYDLMFFLFLVSFFVSVEDFQYCTVL